MRESDLLEIVSLIQEEHPTEEYGDRRLALWLRVLAPFETEEVAAAVVRCLGARRFAPKVAEIVEQIEGREGQRWAFERRRDLRKLEHPSAIEREQLARLEARLWGRMPPAANYAGDDRWTNAGSPVVRLGDTLARRSRES